VNKPHQVAVRQKRERQAALLRLVRQQPIRNQNQLVRLLNRRGFSAAQASVSRDVRELGLVKLNGRYVPAGRVAAARRPDGRGTPPDELIVGVTPVGANLLIVKTPIGAASALAVELDRLALPEIAGTIAGDDTVFVAVHSRAAQGRVLAHLKTPHGAAPNPAGSTEPPDS
jgi:transcriptional regulator of arginine metabolism